MPVISSGELTLIKISEKSFDDIETLEGRNNIISTKSENSCFVINNIQGNTEIDDTYENLFDGVLSKGQISLLTSSFIGLKSKSGDFIATSGEYVTNVNPIAVDPSTEYCLYRHIAQFDIHIQWYDFDGNIIHEDVFSPSNYTHVTSPDNAMYMKFYEQYTYYYDYYSFVKSSENIICSPSLLNKRNMNGVKSFSISSVDLNGTSSSNGRREISFENELNSWSPDKINSYTDYIERENSRLYLYKYSDIFFIPKESNFIVDTNLSDIYCTVFKLETDVPLECFANNTICDLFSVVDYTEFINSNREALSFKNGIIYFKVNNSILSSDRVGSFKELVGDNGIKFLYLLNEKKLCDELQDYYSIIASYDNYTKIIINTSNNVFPLLNVTFKPIDWYKNYKLVIENITNYNSDVSVLKDAITSKVWMSDITTAIDKIENTEIKVIKDQYATVRQDLDGITTTVGNITTITGNLGDRLLAAESKIEQNADNISLTVRKDSLISEINQSAEEVLISASKINLVGAVTAESLAVDAIKSRNYAVDEGGNCTAGSFLNLSDGKLISMNAELHGTIFVKNGIYFYNDGSGQDDKGKFLAFSGGILSEAPIISICQNASFSGDIEMYGSYFSMFGGDNPILFDSNNGQISINSKLAISGSDNWLKFNQTGNFTSGVYFGSSVVRTDGSLQVGSNGEYFNASSSKITAGKRLFATRGVYAALGSGAYYGQFIASGGNSNFIIRNDGNNTWFLLGSSGEDSPWNDLRPFVINNSTGYVQMNCGRLRIGPSYHSTDVNYSIEAQGDIVTSGNMLCAALYQTSSERYKDNISKFEGNALEKIMNSVIYKYNLKTELMNGKKIDHYGFIIERETPKEFIGSDNMSIDDYSIIAFLAKAIQEQQKEITLLKKQLGIFV